MPVPQLNPTNKEKSHEEDVCIFAQTNYRNQMRRFGIKLDDRRRHMYVVGKTGMGKTTMLENMVLHDIYAGHGVGIVDPHGDYAEKIINYIPPHRINDVVYFNPADIDYPIGFNILEVNTKEQKHLVAAGLMGIFKKIWPDVWSSRMEYILNNTILALLDYQGSTLLGINRLLADKDYRKKVIRSLTDPVVKSFWQNEFASYNDRYAQEAVAPIQNKIGQFLSASVIRNIVAQVKSTINVRQIMDSQKIFIMNLSKGRIGEDNSRLLGGMLITEIQLAAMERVDTPEKDRKDFFLYVDEFQNFASPSFANILSEARKYRLGLIMAHQYITQLDELVANAVFGNVGTIISYRVGGADAEFLIKEFTPVFTEEDLVNLSKFNIALKLMIDGVASAPFSAVTLPPIGSATGSAEKVIKVSRERYAKTRQSIEEKIIRWSGMEETKEESEQKPAFKNKKDDNRARTDFKPRTQFSTDKKHIEFQGKKIERIERRVEPKPEVKNIEKKVTDQEIKTISLKDLLPPKENSKPEEKNDLKQPVIDIPEKKTQNDVFLANNPQIKNQIPNLKPQTLPQVPKKNVEPLVKPIIVNPVNRPTNPLGTNNLSMSDILSKSQKKRKRRKKNKNRENATQTNILPSPSQINSVQERKNPEPQQKNSPQPQQEIKPKILKQDEIIKFEE